EGATTNEMINQVKKCPSGALSFYLNNDKQKGEEKMSDVKIDLMENGPILINGKIELKNSNGDLIPTETTAALCRCGGSKNKPFCDGTHVTADFKS
nr:CDGSH iron-sulfur domain-containing protein [Bacteroidales bacterium]